MGGLPGVLARGPHAGGGSRRLAAAVAPAVLLVAFGAMLWILRIPSETAAAVAFGAALSAAIATRALVDLEGFALTVLLGAMIYVPPLVQPGGAQVAVADLLLVVVLGAWLVRAATGRAPALALKGNPLLGPALLYTAITAASLVWSTNRPETIKSIIQITEIVVALLLVFASLPSSLPSIRRGLLAYVWASGVLAAITVAHFLPRALAGDLSPQYLPGLHKNAIGSFLGVGLVLAYALAQREGDRRVRRMLWAAALLELAGLAASMSRGAGAGAVAGVVVATVLIRPSRSLVVGLIASALVATAISSSPPPERVQGGGYETALVRVYSFDNAVEKIRAEPLLGTGAGTYRDVLVELEIGLTDPNNVLLLTWAELGVFGLAAFVFLLWRFGLLLAATRRLPGDARALAAAAGAGALSLIVHFQVDSTWTRGTASLCFALLGLMLAARRLAPVAVAPPAPALVEAGAPPPAARAPATPPGAPRVLHLLTSDAFAGIERHVLRLARELRARGCAAEIACPPGAARLRAEAAAVGIPVHPTADASPRAWLVALGRRLATEPPDVIHVHDGRAAVAGEVLGRFGRPVVVRTQHFMRPASVERQGWRKTASLGAHRIVNRGLGGYVAVSQSAAREAAARDETGRGEVAVIAPGIDLPGEEAVARAIEARAGAETPTVAFVGRLEAEKRLDVLLEAIPLVLESVPACRFVIAGAGSAEERLRRLAERHGAAAALTWAGEVPDPSAVLEIAHVYVNPSTAEGFGLATAEAMAMALPVVAAAAGASAELVEDGVSGLLARPGDPAALAVAIAGLAGDRGRAARMGLEARRRATARFGADRTAELTLALYRRLQAQRRA